VKGFAMYSVSIQYFIGAELRAFGQDPESLFCRQPMDPQALRRSIPSSAPYDRPRRFCAMQHFLLHRSANRAMD
jgi:hypothetical protein